jgi:hypothetical protein
VDGKIINSVGGCVLDSAGSGSSPMADCCEHGTKLSSFINGRESLG